MIRETGATRRLAMDLMKAVAEVGDRHKLHPNQPDDGITLVMALGVVTIGILKCSIPTANGVTIQDKVRNGRKGTAVTVHNKP